MFIQYKMMNQPKLHFWRVKNIEKPEDPPRSKKSTTFRCARGKLPEIIDNWSLSEGDDEERYGVLKALYAETLWDYVAVGYSSSHMSICKSASAIAPLLLFSEVNPEEMATG